MGLCWRYCARTRYEGSRRWWNGRPHPHAAFVAVYTHAGRSDADHQERFFALDACHLQFEGIRMAGRLWSILGWIFSDGNHTDLYRKSTGASFETRLSGGVYRVSSKASGGIRPSLCFELISRVPTGRWMRDGTVSRGFPFAFARCSPRAIFWHPSGMVAFRYTIAAQISAWR